MIFAKQVPKILWPEAVAYACYIKNRTPTRALGADTTPFQAFFGKKPNIGHLEEFGKKCWIQVPDQRRTKLEPKSKQYIFTGVAANAKAWRYYNVHTRHVQTSRNIIFDEIDNAIHPVPDDDDPNDLVAVPRTAAGPIQPPVPATAIVPKSDAATVPVAAEPMTDPRRSTRLAGKPMPKYHHMHEGERTLSVTEIMTEPMSYAEALHRDDYHIWKEAMEIEMAQHAEVGTWELVELLAGKNVVGSRWVYAAKTDAKGKFDLAKARVVAQGFMQRPGMDYFQVTSPIVKLDSLRLILALAIQKGWEIEMMDVKGAYLNSTLDEGIYEIKSG
jgi:Reverse transcriptase (RNA-dependent DNA polymerase)